MAGSAKASPPRARPAGLLTALPICLVAGLACGSGASFLNPPRHAAVMQEQVPAHQQAPDIVLPAIVTNLAHPQETFIRLQAGLVLAEGQTSAPGAMIAHDFMAYLRTLRLDDLRGASGLMHLRDDLAERARARSNGAVIQVVFHELVIQ